MEKILTVNDVAAVLQVKAITVREMFREKRLRGFKVGKSWRTTEVMLQEDINSLARGEAPVELSTSPEVSRTPPMSSPKASAPRAEPPKAEAAMAAETPPPAPRAARKSPAAGTKDMDESGEDTQQLLF
jgi:excisionase family DNA binding protein